jgi:ParB family transcriptional regulator, chromosome partitioning protein
MLPESLVQQTESKTVQSIPLQWIRPNPYQPRRNFSEKSIDDLARSIRRYGLMQPIVVRQVGPSQFELIAGERRLRASKRAGLSTIDAIVHAVGEQDSAVMALIENLQRENLHFFDEAEAFRNLLLEHGITQEELARRIGKNQSTVANKLRILKMAPKVRDAIYSGHLTERHARTLLRVPDVALQLQLIQTIHDAGLSVKATEELVERTLDRLYNEHEAPARKHISGIIRDGRLLINSVRKLVEQANSSGLPARLQLKDMADVYEVVLHIPKRKL